MAPCLDREWLKRGSERTEKNPPPITTARESTDGVNQSSDAMLNLASDIFKHNVPLHSLLNISEGQYDILLLCHARSDILTRVFPASSTCSCSFNRKKKKRHSSQGSFCLLIIIYYYFPFSTHKYWYIFNSTHPTFSFLFLFYGKTRTPL